MKKLLSVGLTAMLLCSLLFVTAGCGSESTTTDGDTASNETSNEATNESSNELSFDGVETAYTYLNGVYTMSVPKNDAGEAKYEFTEEMPEGARDEGAFYLDTDNATFVFSTEGLSYNTSSVYKEKYGEKDATFDGYVEWVKDADSGINMTGLEELDINGRGAIRYCISAGSDGDYKYFGYRYLVSLDDVSAGSNLEMSVYYKSDDTFTAPEEFDQETLDIISSLAITANN